MKNILKSLSKDYLKQDLIYLIIFFVVCIFLRFYLIPDNLFFGPEQGIDFAVIKKIAIDHDFTLIGAKTDINGVFHGPIYYYLATIPFLITRGNPVWVSFFFIALNSLTVFLIYYLGKAIFYRRVGIISALFFTFSYGSIVYSRWLSSHPLSFPLSTLFFIFILRFLKNKKYSLYGAAIAFGLLGQAEFLNFIFFGAITILILIYYKDFLIRQKKTYLLGSLILLIIFSTWNYIIFDIRNEYLISKSLIDLINKDSGYYISMSKSLFTAMNVFIYSFSQFVFPVSKVISAFVLISGLTLIIKSVSNKNKSSFLIVIWLLTPVIILIISRHDILEQFYVSVAPAALILTAFMANYLWRQKKIFGITMTAMILTVQSCYWIINIPINKNIFFQAPQLGLRYSDQIKAIDYIYETAGDELFSFQAYTIPYWMPQAWEFLFWQYGEHKYKRYPVPEKAKKLFVIIQEDPSNTGFQRDWLEYTVSKWGKKVDEKRIGVLKIQLLQVL